MKFKLKNMTLAALLVLPCISDAVVVTDDFTQAAAQNSWTASGGACLTAGNNQASAPGVSVIPACAAGTGTSANNGVAPRNGGTTGTLPDAPGKGALRLTNNQGSQHGSIVYNANFPTDQGLQATFTTYVYNGSGTSTGSSPNLGADGIGFFLLDGSLPKPANVGASGGSLGYSCSNANSPYDGVSGGYLGLGLDEWGNFSTGVGDSTATGGPKGFAPNTIALRGGGSVTAADFAAKGYDSTQAAIKLACQNGYATTTTGSGSNKKTTKTTILDYPYITGVTLPVHYPLQTGDIPLAKSTTALRPNAIPITYKLKITPSGYLSLSYSYNGGAYAGVIANQNILDPTVSGPLPSSFRFGFSGGTGGSTNIHELSCFIATPANVSSSSGGINTVNGPQVQVGTQVYFALYHPDNWWGQMTANSVVVDPTTNVPSISATANWDGSCNLTGGGCEALGTDANGVPLNNVTAQATRTILTSNGSGVGTAFTWSGITTSQQTALNVGPGGVVDTNGQNRLNYLRGDRTQEQPTNSLRQRTSVLGDIVDSSPAWVGPPNLTYPPSWVDLLYPASSNPETSYAAFVTASGTRPNVVYVGSNDGMLHGFRAGSYNADGTYNTASNDGNDVLDYLPASVLANLPTFTDPLYAHSYYVNAIPATGDLFYGNAWHSWLVGGLGAGGNGIYALDVTDPTQFSQANASTLVIGEWTNTNSTLTNLGNTYGTPLIRRMHNGKWAVIFGNGFNSASGNAGIYIMMVDPTTGKISTNPAPYWLPTGTGTSTTPDGIAYVASADWDSDHVVDYLYAGDLLGNVWRFDVTSSDPADWGVSKYGRASGTPLFTATNSGGMAQPITTKIAVSIITVGSKNRVLLMFGTGQKTPFTATSADIYAGMMSNTTPPTPLNPPLKQSVYGVWDWDMSKWNSGTTTANGVVIPASVVQFTPTLTGPQSITRSNLTTQTTTAIAITPGGPLTYRTLSNNAVCWQGTTSCAAPATNNKFGWLLDLPLPGEQVVYSPVLYKGTLELNTTIPPASGATSCTVPVPTGWTMAFNPLTGGALPQSFFINTGNSSNNSTGPIIMGEQNNGAGSPGNFGVGTSDFIFGPTTSGGGGGGGTSYSDQINPQNNLTGKRITWKQIQ